MPTDHPRRQHRIGGWLYLWILVCAYFVGRSLLEFIGSLPSVIPDLWEQASNLSSPGYRPLLKTFLLFKLLGRAALLAYVLFGLVPSIVRRSRLAPRVAIGFHVVHVVAVGIDRVLLRSIYGEFIQFLDDIGTGGVWTVEIWQALAACIVWVPYFIRSERVKATFISEKTETRADGSPSQSPEFRPRPLRFTCLFVPMLIAIGVLLPFVPLGLSYFWSWKWDQAINEGRKAEGEHQYEGAKRHFERALKIANEHRVSNRRMIESLVTMGPTYERLADYESAERTYQEAVSLLEPNLHDPAKAGYEKILAYILNRMAGVYLALGMYSRVEPMAVRALKIQETVYGPQSSEVAWTLDMLGHLAHRLARFQEAEEWYRRSYEIRKTLVGPKQVDVGWSLVNLSALYDDLGRFQEAKELARQGVGMIERSESLDSLSLTYALARLGRAHHNTGDYTEASRLYRRVLSILESQVTLNHPYRAWALNDLAELAYDLERYDESFDLAKRAASIFEQRFGAKHPDAVWAWDTLAKSHQRRNQFPDAVRLALWAQHVREQTFGPSHPEIAISLSILAEIYMAQKKYAEAEVAVRRSLSINEQVYGQTHPKVAFGLQLLADLNFVKGQTKEAGMLFEQAIKLYESSSGTNTVELARCLESYSNVLSKSRQTKKGSPQIGVGK